MHWIVAVQYLHTKICNAVHHFHCPHFQKFRVELFRVAAEALDCSLCFKRHQGPQIGISFHVNLRWHLTAEWTPTHWC